MNVSNNTLNYNCVIVHSGTYGSSEHPVLWFHEMHIVDGEVREAADAKYLFLYEETDSPTSVIDTYLNRGYEVRYVKESDLKEEKARVHRMAF